MVVHPKMNEADRLQQAQLQQQLLLQQAPISTAFLKVEEPSPELRADALMEFMQLLNSCSLSEGLELGHQVRIEGGVLRLCQLLLDPSPDVVSLALWCLGNLCSDSVDPQSKVTKALLLECGAELAILRCLSSEDVSTLVYAAGLCLNLSSSAEWCAVMLVEGAIVRFEQLVHHSEPQARRMPTSRSAPRLLTALRTSPGRLLRWCTMPTALWSTCSPSCPSWQAAAAAAAMPTTGSASQRRLSAQCTTLASSASAAPSHRRTRVESSAKPSYSVRRGGARMEMVMVRLMEAMVRLRAAAWATAATRTVALG